MPTRYPVTIRFDEADPAGILFFGRVFAVAHRVMEQFVVDHVVSRWEDWFKADAFIVPIRHAEADYFAPMRPARRYEAEVYVSKLGSSSFEVTTRFHDVEGLAPVLCAETRVTHVFVDPGKLAKVSIPSDIKERLAAARQP